MSEDQVELPEGQEFFKLNEVCKLANVQPYMLRFWGTEFPQLEAQKSDTGQRLYSRAQMGLVLEIRRLLFDEGLTIAGTRKRLNTKKKGVTAETKKKAAKPRKKPAAKKEEKTAPPVEPPPAATATAAEVDKATRERVQPLLTTLKDVRGEVAKILSELKPEE